MTNVNGNSSTEEIMLWIEQKNQELNLLVEESNNNPSEVITTKGKTLLNNVKTLIKEKIKVMTSEKDPELNDFKNKTNELVSEMEKNVNTISSKETTESDASMALSQLMNDNTFKEIQEIEKQILYRKFYFPGGIPKLRIAGTGTNKKTDEFEYDQTTGDRDPFDHWDPRYLDTYIIIAKQNGFYKNFIYYDGYDYKTINFTQAANLLKKCVNWSTGKIEEDGACDKYEIAGVLGGLKYFDKIDSFLESSSIAGGKSSIFNKTYIVNGDLINPMIEKLEALTNQSMKEFKEKNFGWMANSNKYAFDSAQYLEKWLTLEKQYEEYKDKVWKILENTNALQLCTNNVNVTGNNITIQQEMSCIQSISGDSKTTEENKEEDINSDDNDDNDDGNKSENNDDNSPDNNDDNKPDNKDDNKDDNKIVYIIVSFIVFVILGVSLYLIFKKPSIPEEYTDTNNVEVIINN